MTTALRQAARDVLAIDHLSDFVRQAWEIVEPGTRLAWNWHIDIICDALERQTHGDPDYRRVLICIPPGCMKSLLVSVFHPAWEWLHHPERRKLFLANDDDLVVRDSRRTREIVTSEWYRRLLAITERERGRDPWVLAHDQNEKTNFENSRRGFRQCRSIGSTITGKRADGIVIDDPIDAKEVVNGSVQQVARRLQEVANVVDVVLPSRVNDLATATWTVIMQRLHTDDTAGRALREGGWNVINISMEFDVGEPLNHPDDPRRVDGELMFAAKFPPGELAVLRRKLGARHYGAQYRQRPTPAEGGMFHREWFRHRYSMDPQRLALSLDEQAISVDCSFKGLDDNDYVVMQVWGRRRAEPARKYLLDQVRGRMFYPETKRALRQLAAKWPQAVLKLVEEKANGAALIADLQSEIPGLVAYDPKVSKEARAGMAAVEFEAGDVWLPEPQWAPWVGDYEEEHCAFPGGANDDQVDGTSQMLVRWGAGAAGDPLERAAAMLEAMHGVAAAQERQREPQPEPATAAPSDPWADDRTW